MLFYFISNLSQSKPGLVQALRLDTLGNLPQTELPLTDLVQENITIKKFVYDDDDDDTTVPELIVAKNTRSKRRKNRS